MSTIKKLAKAASIAVITLQSPTVNAQSNIGGDLDKVNATCEPLARNKLCRSMEEAKIQIGIDMLRLIGEIEKSSELNQPARDAGKQVPSDEPRK